MKICPTCSTEFSDDANFCPMDASKLSPAPVREKAAPVEKPSAGDSSSTLLDQKAPSVAGRFALGREMITVPTGSCFFTVDATNEASVLLQLVDSKALPTPSMAERAIRELKQLGKVRSERILRVIDQGKAEDGRVYVASEHVDGPTLEELVGAEGPLSVERARSIVLGVGEALAEAQKVGVIHRDMSPRNVLLTDTGVKVTGFGLAEPIDDKIFGAPAFLSPEQAEGKAVDQRSNIYSLGALLYYLTTGETPFAGDAAAMVQQHLHAVAPPPSQKRAGLSAELDRTVMKALEKSSGRRHLTLRQFLNEVETLPTAPLAEAVVEKRSQSDLATAKTILPGATKAAPATREDLARTDPSPTPKPTLEEVAPPAAELVELEQKVVAAVAVEKRAAEPAAGGKREAKATIVVGSATPVAKAAGPKELAATQKGDALPELNGATAKGESDSGSSSSGSSTSGSSTSGSSTSGSSTSGSGKGAAGQKSDPKQAKVELKTEKQDALPAQKAGDKKAQPAQAQKNAPAGKGGKKAFRETGWFKKGELEEELARRAAELAVEDPLAGPAQIEAVVENESITSDDRARLSLKTGRTEMMQAIKPGTVPAEQMSEEDMLSELDQSRKWMVFAGVAIGLLAVVAAVYFLFMRGPGTPAS